MGGHGAPHTRGRGGRRIVGSIDEVFIPAEYGYYGTIDGMTPSFLYKKYVGWHTAKYGTAKAPMTFNKWLEWARGNGIVQADGHLNASAVIDMKIPKLTPGEDIHYSWSADATPPPATVNVNVNMKRSIVSKIFIALGVVTAIGIVISLVKPETK